MRLERITIDNFRLLKEFELNLEKDLSLVIGKNNTGKTSILSALDKLVIQSERNSINYEDFNVDLRSFLEAYLDGKLELLPEESFVPLGIRLKLYIKYDLNDDLSQVSQVIMNLDPEDDNIILSFEYLAEYNELSQLKADYLDAADKFENKPKLFLKDKHSDYFGRIIKKSILFDDESQFIDLQKERINLKDIVSIQFISAKRSVTNKQNDKTLSNQTSTLYKQADESEEQIEASDEFKKELRKTDEVLGGIYQKMFDGVIQKVSKFGGLSPSETDIRVASTLQHRELLEGNTTVMYAHRDHELPEHYNGLGYMNLISMIFEIEMLMSRLRRSLSEKPAAVNVLFIEEPEAHTHPQMQYVFINNIKELLKENQKREDGIVIQLQSIITTHSSHIVAESDFDDIKFLKKCSVSNRVVAKNLKELASRYQSQDAREDEILQLRYKFLKQYLTLNRAELFFADKAIFIEGDTERIVLPAMMKKIDMEEPNQDELPLLSQNVSIVEVGAHSQIFEKFIEFLGIKSLVITDIDSNKEVPDDDDPEKMSREKCKPSDPDASQTSNSSLDFYFGTKELEFYKNLEFDKKSLNKSGRDNTWKQDDGGFLKIVYQTEEQGYFARSYEDAFFSINKPLLELGHDAFPSLTKKWLNKYLDGNIDAYEFAEKGVGSKPSLAIEILLHSKPNAGGNEFSNWQVPLYIKEGLLWLRN
ncbi:ATP-dependent endonuclease [Pseudoalteromonas luteoviolacea]|uniref:ATP-dependent endonuclease n=1 Tax=Pseudoalteromonas luteoviolacea TaxID=43657 RepID=A0A1C0TRI4_9GAMM|nr:ATP-dependent endonuclease [Pseudoalteromonas luteoviolacea]OCQ21869.1 ATP-dependent endonuclease [Pseudoalteromonas luteoviolacea]